MDLETKMRINEHFVPQYTRNEVWIATEKP